MASNIKDGSSYLDGVPVKISAKFLPPRHVIIPTAIDTTLSADLFLEQYDFSLEKSVLESIGVRQSELAAAGSKPDIKSSDVASGTGGNQRVTSDKNSNGAHQVLAWWQSDTILQPQLQQSVTEKSLESDRRTVSDAKINLSDFENDMSSPFDYMELQTINDLEELSSVFQGIQPSDPPVADEPDEETETSNSIEAAEPNLEKEDTPSSAQNEIGAGVAKSVSFPLPENSGHSSSSNQISSSVSENFDPTRYQSSSLFNPGAGAFSAVPLRDVDSFSTTVPKDLSCDSVNYPSLSQVPYISSSAWENSEKATLLRGSKSYSDISSLSEYEAVSSPAKERSRTPPSRSSEAVVMIGDPLPIKDHFGKSSNTNNGISNYYSDDSAYDELNEDSKRFVDCITEMGFAKGQVSRAVKHLGVDEKKVVEHLCHIQALEESGYESSEAEAALHLHDYNRDQAKEFLDLVNQFQDLGFEKDAVKKALVQNKNDWNKTIDALLPSS